VHLRELPSNFSAPLLGALEKSQTKINYSKPAGQDLFCSAAVQQAGVEPGDESHVRQAIRQPNRKLQPAEVDKLVERYVAGESLNELGRSYGMHHQTVRAHLRRRGIGLRQTYVSKREARKTSVGSMSGTKGSS